ncbi:hypothetical protein Lbys_0082 [Leadbetterella byssophila DSM 17132]|uniref:Gingipain domain-containing protein n=1 Tax=Leadbetterella byssophila (strain DSM 17132 / JCM 16389 / KACC 11308 / NBRC 106382 / 4M15) TaxID=649349 RepID=E4RSM8_LEAB4|nr:C25 family cysteine peptidase [Leadbetterella byssophila]ADQ15878.1 hypothetical protein Lbys_0082 [Leadbetterella byssophila DSM 17132]
MRDRFILIMALIFGYSAQAQYNNDWIQYDQMYLKMVYTTTGVYRIYKKDIEKLPSGIINPHNIQIFKKGKEIPCYEFGLNDNTFDESDYLELYLEANYGEQDSLVYLPHSDRPPVYSNIFSDETAIFITVGKNKGLRNNIEAFKDSRAKENIVIIHEIQHLKDIWSFNNATGQVPILQQSYYEKGESWTGPQINSVSEQKKEFTLQGYSPLVNHNITFKVLLNTRSNNAHEINAKINLKNIGAFKTIGFDHQLFISEIPNSELSEKKSFTFSTSSNLQSDAYSWTQFELLYPQKLDFKNRTSPLTYLPSSSEAEANFIIENAPEGLLAYDNSNPFSSRKLPVDNNSIYISNRKNTKKIFLDSKISVFTKSVVVRYSKPSIEANYLIVTHPTLRSSAEEYKTYRTSILGGSYKVEIMETQEIYDQFNYGERSPIAIKEYLRYQLQKSQNGEKFLFLIGKPNTYPSTLFSQPEIDLVPSFGYPGSDVLLSSGINGSHIDVSTYLTGRIEATNNAEVLNYLEKVKEFEDPKNHGSWIKKVLHMNGGNNINEISNFKNFMYNLGQKSIGSISNTHVDFLTKSTTESVENINIGKYLNEGVGVISYFGHGSSTILDFNLGFASDPKLGYANKGKYPFMLFNGCGVGNIFHRYEPLSSDWLFTPNKGAIAVLANSYYAYSNTSMDFFEIFYNKLYNDEETLGKPIAKVYLESVKTHILRPNYEKYAQSNSQQMILQGDPAVVVNPFHKPDYTWKKNSVQISSTNAGSSIGTSSQIVVSAEIQNLGKIEENQAIPVKAVVQYLNGTSESIGLRKITRSFENSYSDTLHITQPIRNITLILNPDSNIPELTFENNTENIEVDWDQAKNVSIYPYRPELDKTNPTLLAFINDQLTTEGKYTKAPKITFKIQDENPLPVQIAGIRIYIKTNNQFTEIPTGQYTLTQNSANQITGTFVSPEQIGNYELLINASDAAGNLAGQDLYLKWEIVENLTPSIIVAPNPVQERIKLLINSVGQDQVALQLYDLKGKEVFKSTFLVNDGLNTIYLDFSPKQGTYTYVGTLNLKKITGKIIVE